jgi:hypothetical protein
MKLAIYTLLQKQAQQFVQEICVNTWGMNEQEIKQYCLMIVRQNVLMAQLNSDYLATAVTYAPFAGIAAEEIEKLIKKGVRKKHEKTNSIR